MTERAVKQNRASAGAFGKHTFRALAMALALLLCLCSALAAFAAEPIGEIVVNWITNDDGTVTFRVENSGEGYKYAWYIVDRKLQKISERWYSEDPTFTADISDENIFGVTAFVRRYEGGEVAEQQSKVTEKSRVFADLKSTGDAGQPAVDAAAPQTVLADKIAAASNSSGRKALLFNGPVTFVSYTYFALLALTVILYYVMPALPLLNRFKALQPLILLAVSILFCCSFGLSAVVWILCTTVVTYFGALLMDRCSGTGAKKALLIAMLVLSFGALYAMKYLPFTMQALGKLLSLAGVSFEPPAFTLVAPVGISFYIFQVTGYLLNVYRGKTGPVRSFIEYALAVTFFAKLIQGPIEPVNQFVCQLKEPKKVDPLPMRRGALLILMGLVHKVVIADRLAVASSAVFGAVRQVNGLSAIIGAVFYAFQLYCDFTGYTEIALGTALLFGLELVPNFRRPYLARSIGEFWRRWHISLSDWLKENIYFPLGGSRVKPLRWAFNVMVVFAVSGLWHGANYTFIIWGLLHGAYQIAGKCTAKPRAWLKERFMGKDTWLAAFTSVAVTFVLVTIGWVFFRADSVLDAMILLKRMVVGEHTLSLKQLGLTSAEWYFSLAMIALTVIMDLIDERTPLAEIIEGRCLPVRWVIYLALLFLLILFGMYGSLSEQSFIYVSF